MNPTRAENTRVPPNTPPASAAESPHRQTREQDAIYQHNRIVARVGDVQIGGETREIRFGEVFNSDELLLPEDCEFQDYRILVQHIDFASKEERGATHKGRVLRGVVAEILGRREP